MAIEIEHLVSTKPKPKIYNHLYVQVVFAIALGIAIGLKWPDLGKSLEPLGTVFIALIKMIIAPVIFLTIVVGIAGMSNLASVGRVAGKAFIYFLTFSTLALIIGLIVANVFQPGHNFPTAISDADKVKALKYAADAQSISIIDFFKSIVPKTLVSAFTEGNLLQVLLVAILFGISLASIGERGKPILTFCQNLIPPVFKLVSIIMRAAPIGAFGAIAFTAGAYGSEAIFRLGYLILLFYLTSVLFVVIILGAVCRYNGFSIFKLVRYIKDELLLILGTSSSESALPSLMDKMEKAGAKKSVVGLVVPTGYSFNLDGTNIYMTLAALFIIQAYGVPVDIWHQLALLGVAMVSSKGAAGVSGAGFVTLAATIAMFPTIPAEGLGLILGIDRFMSECRALTNFTGNAVACVVVAKWENALDQEQLHATLDRKTAPDAVAS
ncbi:MULTISPECIES: dicarboxylate/amino acid:cation symporter [unclassified Bartonella]|uniref:dicarboxylate/amino acid:cation symporter n=1 Tax=unclassified Bartonella TaxID=2645622 RepID=UPI0015F9C68A|nr:MULTISPECIES: dicarboxylate/amino acid:cation symporter [unclassified Bartonella]UXN03679.1 dicarboxylate/amino acid:cation symporter [Bartonella sp. HY406]UXN06650.1 dicarboxylate/amino acid:cation symporter [Bartonella sp. HY761]